MMARARASCAHWRDVPGFGVGGGRRAKSKKWDCRCNWAGLGCCVQRRKQRVALRSGGAWVHASGVETEAEESKNGIFCGP